MRNLSFVLLDMSQPILCHIWMCWDKSHVANNTNKRFLITLCFISVAYLQLDMSQPILCHIWMCWDKSQVASNTKKKFSHHFIFHLCCISSASTKPTCKARTRLAKRPIKQTATGGMENTFLLYWYFFDILPFQVVALHLKRWNDMGWLRLVGSLKL